MVLEAEVKFFESIKTELLQRHEGKYALIVGAELLGVFDHQEDAYKVGIEKRGNIPMLIKQVLKDDAPARVPALTVGLLHART
ncbi:MAG: hypothetical protein HY713_14815 [candidate division NC10 bacterium]|nr:hypothetical protein [candidate division NC10 bacterium]